MKKCIPKHVIYMTKILTIMFSMNFLSMNLIFAIDGNFKPANIVETKASPFALLENNIILDIIIKGSVTDENGDPLPGASVTVEGTTSGTVTDVDGNYAISVPEGSILVFSYMGFESQRVAIDNKTELNVILKQDVSSLNEVVVVGYGTQRKTEITSSITRVTEKDFNKGNINDPIQLLQGKVAGLQIARVGGNPNQPFAVRLRGLSTLGANAEPLVIIDGVIGGSLGNVDPNDIASIDVLKDASAGAIYGTRGSTGVIIITTKSGLGVSVPTFEYSGFTSLERISNTINVATPEQFLEFGGTDYGSRTNWLDEVGRDALSHVHNFSYTGTSAGGLSYRASLNYRDIQGVVGATGFDQLNGRINVSQQLLKDKLTLSGIVSITSRDANLGFAQALRYALTFNPTAPIFENRTAEQLGRDPNGFGGYFETGVQDVFNPIALNAQNSRTSKTNNFLTNFTAEYEIINGWKIMSNFSKQITNTLNGEFFANNALFSGIGQNGRASRSVAEDVSDLFELTSTYNRKIGDVSLNLLGGYSYQKFDFQGFSATNTNFITNGVTYNNLGLGLGITNNQASMSSIREEAKLGAYFGRINLNYKDFLFLSSSLRREASSRFGANNRWGNFWAISGGIDIDKWLDIAKIDQLKLRAGYGVTGNEPAQRYAYLERLGRVGTGFVNGEFVPAIAPVSNPNPDLKWEEKAEFNVGLDFGFFNSKLSGTVDYFVRNTIDLLNVIPVPSPPNLFGTTLVNLGEIETKGLEVQLNYDVIQKREFNWNIGGNFSTFNSVLLKLNNTENAVQFRGNLGAPGLNNTLVVRVAEGEEIGNIRAAIFAGYNEQGRTLVLDVNGNPTTDRNLNRDGVIVGNGLPDFTVGVNNSFIYKSFDFNFFLRGVFGHSLVNIQRAYWEHPLIAGTQNFVITEFFNPDDKELDAYHSGYVEKADFLRLDNASLGYTVRLPRDYFIRNLRIYLSGNNLFTITKYTGADPEVRFADPGPVTEGNTGVAFGGDILVPGIDRRVTYFPTSSIQFGVNLKF
ncbi:SusC/RagA family TonB-linked outer membrane protein [Cyclobacteriaceae bacterium YHN15]|nr:SusC/RagA family TonB-linked outer membrane protein [Cyclobacteriaceae bacterium YHN15]